MNHSVLPAARGLAAVLLAAFATSGIASEPKSKPFKAELTVTESVTLLGAAPCFAIGTVQATGTATHLGKFTAASQDCINPRGVFDPSGPNSFSFASGAAGLVFIAANGDNLFAAYSGNLTAQPTGPHHITGQFVITGGTGRFLGATGGGILTGYEDISQVVSGFGQIKAIGKIVY